MSDWYLFFFSLTERPSYAPPPPPAPTTVSVQFSVHLLFSDHTVTLALCTLVGSLLFLLLPLNFALRPNTLGLPQICSDLHRRSHSWFTCHATAYWRSRTECLQVDVPHGTVTGGHVSFFCKTLSASNFTGSHMYAIREATRLFWCFSYPYVSVAGHSSGAVI